MNPDLAAAITDSASRLGISPVDLATVISYETAGTFDPWKAGPTTQWGQHRGLIQWGEPQRQKYGVYEGMPVAAQMQAAEKYLADTGFRPGMGMMDLYSAINAGGVGRYNATDANNGGAPGTVADKVNSQMAGHRANAERMFGGAMPPQMTASAPVQAPSAPSAPPQGLLASLAAPEPGQDPKAAEAFQKQISGLLAMATGQNEQPQQQAMDTGLLAEIAPSRFPQLTMTRFRRKA